jgi:hypothetical protein
MGPYINLPNGTISQWSTVETTFEKCIKIENEWICSHFFSIRVDDSEMEPRIRKYTSGGFTDDPPMASLTYPGIYRMTITTRNVVNKRASNAWVTMKDDVQNDTRYFTVNAEPEKGCKGSFNQIDTVLDSDGNEVSEEERLAMGLGSPVFMQGQTIRVPKASTRKGIEIRLRDGSVLRLSKGSEFAVNKCQDTAGGVPIPANVRFVHILGKIWFEILEVVNPEENRRIEFQTERSQGGVRGTVFSVEYDPVLERTEVEVEEHSVSFWNRKFPDKVIIVNEGEKAETIGENGLPKLIKNR